MRQKYPQLFLAEPVFYWKFTQDLWNFTQVFARGELSVRVGKDAEDCAYLILNFLCLKLAFACVGELIWESLTLVTWNKFLLHRSLLSPGRKMASVAVDPQPVWILNSYFSIPFHPFVFWEVNPLPLLDCRVWWPGWSTCPWWAPPMTSSPRPTSRQRINILAWSLCVRWQRRAWRPSRLWQWWVLSPSSRS